MDVVQLNRKVYRSGTGRSSVGCRRHWLLLSWEHSAAQAAAPATAEASSPGSNLMTCMAHSGEERQAWQRTDKGIKKRR